MNPRLVASLLVSILALCGADPALFAHAASKARTSAAPATSKARTSAAATPAAPPTSFHGIAWGTPLADVPGMTVVERDGPATYAKIPGMSPRLADVEVSDIVYAFCQERFAGAMATFQGRDRLDAVRKVVAGRYGQPVDPGDGTQNVGWPLGDVLIMLEFDPGLGAGTLTYLHAPTYAPCEGAGAQATPADPREAAPTGPEAKP